MLIRCTWFFVPLEKNKGKERRKEKKEERKEERK